MALRAKLHLDGDTFFLKVSPSKEYSAAAGVKRLFTVLRAKLYFERQLIFEISRSEIAKMSCLSRKTFHTTPGIFIIHSG